MVLKLYGLATASGTTYAVAVTLHEKKIPFEIVPIDLLNLYNGYRTPEVLAIQPFHQIPAIDDDGFVLYESRAICRYLAEKYPDQGTSLLPTELKAKALFEQAASIEYSNFHPHAFVIYVEGRQKAIKGLEKDQAKFDDAVSKLSAVLQVYETILAKQKYLAGNVSPASSTDSWANFTGLLPGIHARRFVPYLLWNAARAFRLRSYDINGSKCGSVVERDPGTAIPVYLGEGYDDYERGLVLSMVS